MNIYGAMPNINSDAMNVRSANKSVNNVNHNGTSFAQSIGEIARSANITVAHGATASELQFKRRKEVFDKPFNFEDVEEEILDDYLSRIKKMMDDLQK